MSLEDQIVRLTAALERTADLLEKQMVTQLGDQADEWRAAPMARRSDSFVTYHAVRLSQGRLKTACAASGCGGEVAADRVRPLEQVPRFGDPGARRCGASGCRELFAQQSEITEGS